MPTVDSSSKSAGEPRLSRTASSMATGGDHCYPSASQVPMVCARKVLDERPRKRSCPDEGSEAPAAVAPLWANVPADILGTVLRFLPCLADRASVRSMCRPWRAATACVHALPSPLPVLVLPRFRFSCLTCDGALTAARRARMPVEVAGDDVGVVGTSNDWLLAIRPSWDDGYRVADGECFLVNAFSNEVVHLPPLSACHYSFLAESSSALRVGSYLLGTSKRKPWMHCSAVLSASPSSGSKYTVAALSCCSGSLGLALWQPGMTSWYVCGSARIHCMGDDLAFYQGKLYMVWKSRPKIFAFELREDVHGVCLSHPEEYRIDPLITTSNPIDQMRCNLVVWRGKLLLIISFFTYKKLGCKPHGVEVFVFALDFSTSPCELIQIDNFDGDCIFVDTYGCRSFSPGLHVGFQGDLIYFSEECITDSFLYVYNMRDGTTSFLAAGLSEGCFGFPIWLYPS